MYLNFISGLDWIFSDFYKVLIGEQRLLHFVFYLLVFVVQLHKLVQLVLEHDYEFLIYTRQVDRVLRDRILQLLLNFFHGVVYHSDFYVILNIFIAQVTCILTKDVYLLGKVLLTVPRFQLHEASFAEVEWKLV